MPPPPRQQLLGVPDHRQRGAAPEVAAVPNPAGMTSGVGLPGLHRVGHGIEVGCGAGLEPQRIVAATGSVRPYRPVW
ncbi:MAG: hypothetical protein R2755_27330 [Acidimicrobiales bacterium]